MAKANLPPIDVLRQLLRYDASTGKLFWLEREGSPTFNSRFAGKEAFTALNPGGYRYGSLRMKTHLGHVVAWALAYGEIPEGHIDHINGVRDDNRLANLAAGTQAQNNRNAKRREDNRSGHTGVVWYAPSGKWRAFINAPTGWKHIGYFAELADALSARKAAEVEHGFHRNHGRS